MASKCKQLIIIMTTTFILVLVYIFYNYFLLQNEYHALLKSKTIQVVQKQLESFKVAKIDWKKHPISPKPFLEGVYCSVNTFLSPISYVYIPSSELHVAKTFYANSRNKKEATFAYQVHKNKVVFHRKEKHGEGDVIANIIDKAQNNLVLLLEVDGVYFSKFCSGRLKFSFMQRDK